MSCCKGLWFRNTNICSYLVYSGFSEWTFAALCDMRIAKINVSHDVCRQQKKYWNYLIFVNFFSDFSWNQLFYNTNQLYSKLIWQKKITWTWVIFRDINFSVISLAESLLIWSFSNGWNFPPPLSVISYVGKTMPCLASKFATLLTCCFWKSFFLLFVIYCQTFSVVVLIVWPRKRGK